jgi:thiamine-monophosphate kinase
MLGEGDARFIGGLREALEHYRTPLLGGDTTRGEGPQVLGLTAIGRATHVPVPSRRGAKPDHALWITGRVGAAMLGLEALRNNGGDSLAYRRPRALLAEGQALAPHVSAMMDVSDGLLLDAARMARASGVSFAIEAASVPIATSEDRRGEALRWGDDYQLLFTAPPEALLPLAATRIGTALAATPAPVLLDGVPLGEADGLGFQH